MIPRMAVRSALKSLPPAFQAVLRGMLVRPVRSYVRYAPWSIGKLSLFNKISDHLWWLETTVDAMTLHGDLLQVDASDIVGKHIYYFGTWEPHLTNWIQRRLRPGHIFIDVGANIGYFTLLASRLVGETGKVVAIEASLPTFEALNRNIERNRAYNVRTVNRAAWDKKERLRFS